MTPEEASALVAWLNAVDGHHGTDGNILREVQTRRGKNRAASFTLGKWGHVHGLVWGPSSACPRVKFKPSNWKWSLRIAEYTPTGWVEVKLEVGQGLEILSCGS